MKRFGTLNSFFCTLLAGGLCASAESTWPVQTFKSTSIEAPYLNVTKNGKTELGFLFFGPSWDNSSFPAIYSDDGQLVWQGELGTTFAYQPQTLNGEPVLTYWHGTNEKGFGFGHISILNSSYQEVHRLTLASTEEHPFVTIEDPKTFPSYIDIHESHITDQDTMLVTAVNITQMDLTSVGGPKDGYVQDGLVYEIDIKTNEVLFRWSAVEHLDQVPLSYNVLDLNGKGVNKTEPYEYPHLNSIAKYGDDYLISSRYMCSLIMLDKNGDVKWLLHGQKGGDFTLGDGTSFCFQHYARIQSQTEDNIILHMHNNENADTSAHTTYTTGLTLNLDMKTKRVSLVGKTWDSEDPIFATSQGSYQSLTNGHFLAGHGSVPKIEEYDENGALVMRARFGFDYVTSSYRAFRSRWVGRPRTTPSVVACSPAVQGNGNGNGVVVEVYVSWNGATDVQEWKVLAGAHEHGLKPVEVAPKNGFETKVLLVGDDVKRVMVQAVGGVGHGTRSEIVTVETVANYINGEKVTDP